MKYLLTKNVSRRLLAASHMISLRSATNVTDIRIYFPTSTACYKTAFYSTQLDTAVPNVKTIMLLTLSLEDVECVWMQKQP